MNKVGALRIHQPVSAHLLISFLLKSLKFLLKLEVRDISAVAFLAFPDLLHSLFTRLGLWLVGWVWFGFGLVSVWF